MKTIRLKPGREKSLHYRHPWVFAGAVESVSGAPSAGETVDVLSASGEWLSRASYSPLSQIRARVWTWNPDEAVDAAFFARRIARAFEMRRALGLEAETNAMRLVHGESDGIPGVIVDRYADVLVLQCLTAGAECWREEIVSSLVEITGVENVYERSDVEVRHLEGLPERCGLISGELPAEIIIHEGDVVFRVDVCAGQKTGFYMDQRRNRQWVRTMVNSRRVLDCFAYTGGFTVCALAGGAVEVVSVDSSQQALSLAAENVQRNHFSLDRVQWREANVFSALREMRDRGQHFDAVILDPPKFAPTAAQAQKAARAYKDINLLALKMLSSGGLLFTFSCSGGVSAELFQKVVAGAARDAGVEVQIVAYLSQAADHPVLLNFPEGAYLKGLVCRKM